MSLKLIRLGSYFCVLGLVVAAFCVDLPASAGSLSQNANSSTTIQDTVPTNAPAPDTSTPGRLVGRIYRNLQLPGRWSERGTDAHDHRQHLYTFGWEVWPNILGHYARLHRRDHAIWGVGTRVTQ